LSNYKKYATARAIIGNIRRMPIPGNPQKYFPITGTGIRANGFDVNKTKAAVEYIVLIIHSH
jgi:hypothetical protein